LTDDVVGEVVPLSEGRALGMAAVGLEVGTGSIVGLEVGAHHNPLHASQDPLDMPHQEPAKYEFPNPVIPSQAAVNLVPSDP